MSYANPYSFWNDPNGVGSSNAVSSGVPSVYGAFPQSYPLENAVIFNFMLNPDVLNCTVVGPKSIPYYSITTDESLPGYTVIKDSRGKSIGLIEWRSTPLVEIRSAVSKRAVSSWMSLSSDAASRQMEVGGKIYRWMPDQQHINLFSSSRSHPTLLGRISRSQASIVLEITTEAIQRGILDSVLCAAVLLQCGRNID